MKKLLLIIIMFLFVPIAYASGYGIENYYINATIEENGDLLVEECIWMNGTFNGFERVILYRNGLSRQFDPSANSYGGSEIHNGSGMEVLQVGSTSTFLDFDHLKIKTFNKVDSANKGDYKVYTEEATFGGERVLIFLPSKKNEYFYIKYRLKDMAVLHDDVGELGWSFIGKDFRESVANLYITVNIPNNKEITKVWAHGPLNGLSQIDNAEKVSAYVSGLSAYTALDIRAVFDKDVIKDSSKKTNVNALDKIIKYETELAEQANRIRQENLESSIRVGLSNLEDNPNRYLYDEILSNINEIPDEETRTKYIDMLVPYQKAIDNNTYENFTKALNKDKKPNYKAYKKALPIIDLAFSLSLKEQMETELNAYNKSIVKYEWKTDLKASAAIVLVILFAYGYKKLLKRLSLRKVGYSDVAYLRELPTKLSPAAAGVLIDKRLTKDEFSATLLDLIRKKVIIFDKKDDDSYDLLFNYKVAYSYDDYDTESKEKYQLTSIERSVVKGIFKGKDSVNTKTMKKLKSEDYLNTRDKIYNELNSDNDFAYGFIEDKEVYFGELALGILSLSGAILAIRHLDTRTIIALAVGLLLTCHFNYQRYQERFIVWFGYPIMIVIMLMNIFNFHYAHLSLFIGIIGMIIIHKILYMVPNKMNFSRTAEGKEETKKLNAFKSFLLDFSRMDLKNIEEIVLWEDYLIYATALGISKNVIDKMRVRIQELNLENDMFMDYVLFSNLNEIGIITNNFDFGSSTIVKTSMPDIKFPEVSGGGGSWSDGGGGGGGFSGGSSSGGSFGGGGGGGRF